MARTRFAPSPTGSLHAGSVRTALYCLLYARKHGSAFLLRVEDTDRARSTEEATAGIFRDLRWLGLLWDEGPEVGGPHGPYLQSERVELYRRHADQLVASGRAYAAWETSAELSELRAIAEAAKQNFRYRGRAYSDEELARYRAEGREPVIRLRAPGRDVTVDDVVLGEVTVEAEVLDDLVILKADGFPTYHFAVVVDDHHMEIDLVLRGADHVMNTHKHVLIYEALGWDPPQHGHLPLIFNPGGSKMGKRDKAKAARQAVRDAGLSAAEVAAAAGLDLDDVERFLAKKHDGIATAEAIGAHLGVDLPLVEVLDFRRAGYLPEALVNYMALLGWNPGDDREIMTIDEMAEAFDLARVNKTPARFDPDKLLWMNGQYMQQLPMGTLLQHLGEWLEVRPSPIAALDDTARRQLLEMYRPRARTFPEIETLGAFFFAAPTEYAEKQVQKHLEKGDGWSRLQQMRDALSEVGRWEAPSLLAAVEAVVESTGVPLGKFAQPVRIAVTGTGVSPDLFDTIAFLGRDETLARIDRCLTVARSSNG